MKRLSLCLMAFALLFAACSPARFVVDVEMRQASKSGYKLGGKNVSVSYLNNEELPDSSFMASMAEGFASALEKDYFSSEQKIGIYNIKADNRDEYVTKEGMVDLLVETDSDVSFLFELEMSGKPSNVSAPLPFSVRLYAYDAMNPSDTLNIYRGNSTLNPSQAYAEQGMELGKHCANIFLSSWKEESFIFFYDTAQAWYTAAQYADEYKFKEAMEIWMSLLDTKNMLRLSCLEYNIATACYIMGQTALAKEWLDRADSHYLLPDSAALRRRF